MSVQHGRTGHHGVYVLLLAEEDRTKEPENVFLAPEMILTKNYFVQAMPKKQKNATKINVRVRCFSIQSMYFEMEN